MQTVSEIKYYAAKAEKLLTLAERDRVIETLAADPLQGDVIEGTGGIRKLRFAKGNKGKSGGVRIIYYFYNETAPVFLMDIFGKNEKENLSKAETAALAHVASSIKKGLQGKKHG